VVLFVMPTLGLNSKKYVQKFSTVCDSQTVSMKLRSILSLILLQEVVNLNKEFCVYKLLRLDLYLKKNIE